MPIKYFPNRVFSKRSSPVDSLTAKKTQYNQNGSHDATSDALDVVVSAEKDWKVTSVGLTFTPSVTARNYSVDIIRGIRIVEDLNNYLWFHVTGVHPQRVGPPIQITVGRFASRVGGNRWILLQDAGDDAGTEVQRCVEFVVDKALGDDFHTLTNLTADVGHDIALDCGSFH